LEKIFEGFGGLRMLLTWANNLYRILVGCLLLESGHIKERYMNADIKEVVFCSERD
jgi:hypothetical protein